MRFPAQSFGAHAIDAIFPSPARRVRVRARPGTEPGVSVRLHFNVALPNCESCRRMRIGRPATLLNCLTMILGQASYSTMPCRPLLKWPGGKRSELQWIRPLIPPHRRYLTSPFLAVDRFSGDAINVDAYVNDLHKDLMTVLHMRQGTADGHSSKCCSVSSRSGRLERTSIGKRCTTRHAIVITTTDTMTVDRAADFFLIRQFAYGGMFRVSRHR